MKSYYFLSFAILIVLTSCTVNRVSHNNWGCVKICYKFRDSTDQQFISVPQYGPDFRIWYKDSLMIEEVIGLNSSQENDGPEKIWFTQEPYIFIDLRKQYYYKYSSFSDTATLLEKINKTDSIKWGVPWDFYTRKGDFYQEGIEPMPDTLIDGSVFQRWLKKIPIPEKNRVVKHIMYLQCDKKKTPIQFDRRFMENKGCPLVRTDLENSSSEIKFLSDTLTAEQIKVFNAWEKRAKED